MVRQWDADGTPRPQTLIYCLALGLCVLLGPLAPASAQAVGGNEPWRVLEQYGSVRYRTPAAGQWSQAVVGTELPLGSRIVTGEDGWVLIRHADGNFWVEPNARFVLPSPDKARVRQEAGNLHYRIIGMDRQRFEVETPYASLVVKGTTFDVRVSEAGIAAEVARGWVEVATPQGSRADLRAGQAARISSGAEPRFEVRPAPGQAFELVQPDRQITPAVQPLGMDPATRDAGAADDERGWLGRFFDTLRSAPAPTSTADTGGGGGTAGLGGGSSGGGSSSSDSDSSSSSGGGSGGGSGDSGSGGGSSSSGSSGSGSGGSAGSSGSGSGGSGSAGGSDGGGSSSSGSSGGGSGGSAGSSGSGSGGSGSTSGSGGGGSSSSGSGGGVGVGASVGGVGVGASVGGGGVSVGASVGGIGVGVGIGK